MPNTTRAPNLRDLEEAVLAHAGNIPWLFSATTFERSMLTEWKRMAEEATHETIRSLTGQQVPVQGRHYNVAAVRHEHGAVPQVPAGQGGDRASE